MTAAMLLISGRGGTQIDRVGWKRSDRLDAGPAHAVADAGHRAAVRGRAGPPASLRPWPAAPRCCALRDVDAGGRGTGPRVHSTGSHVSPNTPSQRPWTASVILVTAESRCRGVGWSVGPRPAVGAHRTDQRGSLARRQPACHGATGSGPSRHDTPAGGAPENRADRAGAPAAAPGPTDEPTPRQQGLIYAGLTEAVRGRCAGVFRVDGTSDPVLCTHGPDLRPPASTSRSGAASRSYGPRSPRAVPHRAMTPGRPPCPASATA